MHWFAYRNWRLEYLIIRPEQWTREHETNGWLRGYEVLDLWHATRALATMAREDGPFVRKLCDDVLPYCYDACARWDATTERRCLEQLRAMLGSAFSETGKAPHFARLYICRQKPVPRKPPPDPWKETREAIEAAKKAPRGYVVVEVVDEREAPVSGVRVELLFADGEVRTLATDAQGQARADPIPQGQCHIRLPELDGSFWSAADGSPSALVDEGRKRAHVVRQGECLAGIAAQYGIKDWKSVWQASDNETLRAKRKSPNVLLPGDQVVLPERKVHEIVKPTDQTHRIVIGADATLELRLVFRDSEGNALADACYELAHTGLDSGDKKLGSLDGSGTLSERIAVTVKDVDLYFPERNERYRVALSHLDPLESEPNTFLARSAETRLAALGYLARPGGEGALRNPRAAISAFQRDVLGRTQPTGELDAETCQKLEEMYGA